MRGSWCFGDKVVILGEGRRCLGAILARCVLMVVSVKVSSYFKLGIFSLYFEVWW